MEPAAALAHISKFGKAILQKILTHLQVQLPSNVSSVTKKEMQELLMQNEPACARLSAGPTVDQSSS